MKQERQEEKDRKYARQVEEMERKAAKRSGGQPKARFDFEKVKHPPALRVPSARVVDWGSSYRRSLTSCRPWPLLLKPAMGKGLILFCLLVCVSYFLLSLFFRLVNALQRVQRDEESVTTNAGAHQAICLRFQITF